MRDCIFCEIIAAKSPASMVHQDAVCSAFLVLKPVNPGHLVVVPNAHAAFLVDLDEDTGAHILRVARRLSTALRKSGLKCEGVNLFLADGEAAMQEVFHVHLHVIPRFRGDGFGLKYGPDNFRKVERSELDETAGKIRRVL